MFPYRVIEAELLPEAWEKSIVEVWEHGIVIDSEYGERCKEITALIVVKNPLKEPRYHLVGMLDGRLSTLERYVREVIVGDERMERGVKEGKEHYTYHERLFKYTVLDSKVVESEEEARKFKGVIKSFHGMYLVFYDRVINQIEYIIEKLKKVPYSRRAVAITWQPWKDEWADYPPCLQLIQCRVIDGKLNMWVTMRSNDSFKASFFNMYAFTELQRYIADRIGVEVGTYYHYATSYHIYERDWKWVRSFVEKVKKGLSRRYWKRREELRF